MFDKFGEMDSYQELNELAENLANEGDFDSLKAMARENGIHKDFVEMYINGDIPCLTDSLNAALGKLDVEAKELKMEEIMADWLEYIKGQCVESEEMAISVRSKGKNLKDCIGKLLAWSFEHKKPVPKEVTQAAGIKNARVEMGIPGMGRAKKIIKSYYMEETT